MFFYVHFSLHCVYLMGIPAIAPMKMLIGAYMQDYNYTNIIRVYVSDGHNQYA